MLCFDPLPEMGSQISITLTALLLIVTVPRRCMTVAVRPLFLLFHRLIVRFGFIAWRPTVQKALTMAFHQKLVLSLFDAKNIVFDFGIVWAS